MPPATASGAGFRHAGFVLTDFTAGAATVGTVGSTSVAISATDGTGGMPFPSGASYGYTWEQSTDDATWSNAAGTGVTTLGATITGLTGGTLYYLRLRYQDINNQVQYGATVTATTSGGGGARRP